MADSSSVISRLATSFRSSGAKIAHDAPEFARVRLPLAIATLDALLGGGLPCGAITEIVGGISTGRTTLARALIAAAIRAGECAAWLDLPNAFDPGCACSAEVDLQRMLWVSPADRVTAVRAAEHVLDAGGFRVVVLDLGSSSSPRAMLPASVWLRMSRAAAHRDAAIVVIGATRTVGAFATVSLEVRARRRVFVGEHGPRPVFERATSALYVRKHRFAPTEEASVELVASTGT